MKTYEKVLEIVERFVRSGNTSSLMSIPHKVVVLFHSKSHADQVKSQYGDDKLVASLNSTLVGKASGGLPLVIDNYTVQIALTDAIKDLNRLKVEISKMEAMKLSYEKAIEDLKVKHRIEIIEQDKQIEKLERLIEKDKSDLVFERYELNAKIEKLTLLDYTKKSSSVLFKELLSRAWRYIRIF